MILSERIRKALQRPGSIFLDTVRTCPEEKDSYLFTEPVKALAAYGPEDITPLFNEIEKALSDGFFVAGYWCYEWGYALIPKLRHLLQNPTPNSPLVWLGIYKDPEVWSTNGNNSKGKNSAVSSSIQNRQPSPPIVSTPELDTSRKDFVRAVNKIKDYIRAGDTYQVNFTVRSRFSVNGAPIDLYERLRALQEVSYGAIIHTDTRWILSLSPELFFHRQGSRIWSKPMKGTISRGSTPEEDKRFAEFLKNDIKNRAENVMIVDLLRNDMGQIADTGSVRVPQLYHIEKYATLFQMISRIEAVIRQGTTWKEIFEALFPCGSITGAPKIRTMEIISSLENSPRGIYTGSIGFMAPDDRAVFNVAIRTVEIVNGQGVMGTGSGITYSSDPEAEFEETRLKTRFLEQAGCR